MEVELTRDLIREVLDEFHLTFGATLAEAWHLPPAVVESVRYHHDDYESAPTNAEAAMTVCLADYLAHWAAPTKDRPVDRTQVEQLEVLEALNIYPDELAGLFELRERVMRELEVIG